MATRGKMGDKQHEERSQQQGGEGKSFNESEIKARSSGKEEVRGKGFDRATTGVRNSRLKR